MHHCKDSNLAHSDVTPSPSLTRVGQKTTTKEHELDNPIQSRGQKGRSLHTAASCGRVTFSHPTLAAIDLRWPMTPCERPTSLADRHAATSLPRNVEQTLREAMCSMERHERGVESYLHASRNMTAFFDATRTTSTNLCTAALSQPNKLFARHPNLHSRDLRWSKCLATKRVSLPSVHGVVANSLEVAARERRRGVTVYGTGGLLNATTHCLRHVSVFSHPKVPQYNGAVEEVLGIGHLFSTRAI